MNNQSTVTPWLLTRPDARDIIRVFCLPYAGGGASVYRGWAKELPEGAGIYPIQLPGRENRIAEPPARDMTTLVHEISRAIVPYLQQPFILFGHSLGARLAFEIARNIRRKWNLQPSRLIVSGSRAPEIPEPKPLHGLPDSAFIEELRRFSGTPEAVLQSRELMELFLPVLRADFTVDETYVYSADKPLECPISAFGGTKDPEAGSKEVQGWARHTSCSFSLEMLEGGHFFLQTARPALLRSVGKILLGHLAAAAVAGKKEVNAGL
ncbi:thioesterase|uniref:Surfactin synthase thioesterase subunit n=1 Tax=Dendrosporobacter quercicolus TaxID=146817 RepID=A0A1G9RRJ8_9FIRM|nr:alpha/beta fold hydrolase [Dendrosporobacter quercicolus]NSL49373.1 thioesterase [Dendrosporobacter quercicolus DSM 1736]SDM25793.1 Surfactin synthase thioesterase subunit [Dendrosporobacter quercicolus]